MTPYVLTLTFLILMSLLTSSEMSRFASGSLERALYHDAQVYRAQAEKEEVLGRLEDFRQEAIAGNDTNHVEKSSPKKENTSKKVKRSPTLRFNFNRPPNNSRLNLYFALFPIARSDLPDHFSYYELAADLIRDLYGEAEFFQRVPQAEYRILDKLKEKREETLTFQYPDELAQIDLGDPDLQEIFYRMLKGSHPYPSLLDYLSFDRLERTHKTSGDWKINLMFAPPELLQALFHDCTLVQKLESLRQEFWKKIIYQEEHRLELTKEECDGRTKLKKEIEEKVRSVFYEYGLDAEIDLNILDLSLGKYGNILLIVDSKTGIVSREKHKPRGKKTA
ncbi:MAG: hypothetical protein K940chlam9_00708 [Chlamydiae bacterium]|nr:hypothetical protein [Chlamydiota bacterium]